VKFFLLSKNGFTAGWLARSTGCSATPPSKNQSASRDLVSPLRFGSGRLPKPTKFLSVSALEALALSALTLLTINLATPSLFGAGVSGFNAPVKKFRLPSFNEQGFRTSLLEGDEATMISPSQIDMREMHLTLFSGDENNRVETTLLAPLATVRLLDQNQIAVEGPSSVRLVRSDLDVAGENWSYRHADKRLTIGKKVHVVIHAQLGDILK